MCVEDDDGGWPEVKGQRVHQGVRRMIGLEFEMRKLAARVHDRVRASRAFDGYRLTAEFLDRGFERRLNRGTVGLPLPADKIAPVVFDDELIARHQ